VVMISSQPITPKIPPFVYPKVQSLHINSLGLEMKKPWSAMWEMKKKMDIETKEIR